ncbi:MAG: heme utilization protein, partial [Rhizobacter sp.]|nr:heme utilization protein [Rhizobacter sp.]
DGLLVMDRNGDGKINDGTELFGVATQKADGSRAGNGYEAMKIEDSNQDGKLTAADARYSELKLWVDANQDGKTDDGELHGLADFGVVSLDLSALAGSEVDNGNLLGLTSSYTTADGATHDMADVWFAKDVAAAPALNELLAGAPAEVLPAALSTGAAPATSTHQASAGVVSIDRNLLPTDDKNLPLI